MAEYNDEATLVYAIQTWEQQHPEEVKKFWAVLSDMDCNVGSTSLYLSPVIKNAKHPWLEWVLSSGLNQDNINQIAPHAPFDEKNMMLWNLPFEDGKFCMATNMRHLSTMKQ